jgi:hypothetical protein
LKIDDAASNLIALTFNEASEIIKDRMQNLQAILSHLDPTSCEPCDSSKYGYAFDSIQLDTYNRFAEKASEFSLKFDYIFIDLYPREMVLPWMFTLTSSTKTPMDIPTTANV